MRQLQLPLRRLGPHPVADFTRRYWQRRPLCVRNAIAGFASPISRAQLFSLARSAQVESRLVSAFSGVWKLRHGPVVRLPPLRRAGWTLLVQGVDLHDAAIAALAARLGFLPAARFDDVMVSYASDGGGVGPHVDQYDVFLLQAQGRRRWRIAEHFDARLVEGLPLRVLANFVHEQEFVLEPGDLLYLPPGVAHEGVALGESITISIGFRLPVVQELAESWYERQARAAPQEQRLPDATRAPSRTPARLPEELQRAALHQLRSLVPKRADVRDTLLEHLTEPKPTVVFDPPRPALVLARFIRAAKRRGLALDLRTRMLYEGAAIGINGELFTAAADERAILWRLANSSVLLPGALSISPESHSGALFALLHSWYRFGWIHLGRDQGIDT